MKSLIFVVAVLCLFAFSTQTADAQVIAGETIVYPPTYYYTYPPYPYVIQPRFRLMPRVVVPRIYMPRYVTPRVYVAPRVYVVPPPCYCR
jgi:hypothetical protein